MSSSDEGEYLDLVIDEQDVIDCPDVASTEKVACVTSVQISMPKELPTQSRSVILPVSSNPTPSTSNIHLVEGKYCTIKKNKYESAQNFKIHYFAQAKFLNRVSPMYPRGSVKRLKATVVFTTTILTLARLFRLLSSI